MSVFNERQWGGERQTRSDELRHATEAAALFMCLSQPRPRAYEAEVFRESCLGDTVVQILQAYTEASKK